MQYIYNRLSEKLSYIESLVSGIGLVVTTLLAFLQVLNRYLFRFEIMWLSDASLYVFIISMLIGACFATAKEGHVRVDIFNNWIVKRRPRAESIYRLVLLLLGLIILSLFLPSAFFYMQQALRYPEYGTLIRWVNTGWFQQLVFVSSIIIFIHLSVSFVKEIINLILILREKQTKGKK